MGIVIRDQSGTVIDASDDTGLNAGDVVSDQDARDISAGRSPSSRSNSGGSSPPPSTPPSPELFQNTTVAGKVYDNVTEAELMSGKLSSNSQAVLDEELTAMRNQAVIADNLRTSIRKKTSSGQNLTADEQFFILTGETNANVASVNRFLEKTSQSSRTVKQAQGNVENVYKYQEDVTQYQKQIKAQKTALNAVSSSKDQTVTTNVFYSKNPAVARIERRAEAILSRDDKLSDFSEKQKTKFFGEGNEQALDIFPADNWAVATGKTLAKGGYAITFGLPETLWGLKNTVDKAIFNVDAFAVSQSNQAIGESFGDGTGSSASTIGLKFTLAESSKEQADFALNQITPIDTNAIKRGEGIKFDPQGTVNLFVASAFASVKASSTIKARKVQPAKGSIKPLKTETLLDKKGNTVITEKGTFQNTFAKNNNLKYFTKTKLDASGKGSTRITIYDKNSKVVFSQTSKINQAVALTPKQPGTFGVKTKTSIKPTKIGTKRTFFPKKSTETFEGDIKQSGFIKETSPGKGSGRIGQEVSGTVKTTGKSNFEGTISKTSNIGVKGTVKTTSEIKSVNAGEIGRFTVETKTFKPSSTSEIVLKSKSVQNPTIGDKISSGITKAVQGDRRIYSFTEPFTPAFRSFSQFTEGFSGNVPRPASPITPSPAVPSIIRTPSPTVNPSSNFIINSIAPRTLNPVPFIPFSQGQAEQSSNNGVSSELNVPNVPKLEIQPLDQPLEKVEIDPSEVVTSNPIVRSGSKSRSSASPIVSSLPGNTSGVDYGAEPSATTQPETLTQANTQQVVLPFTISNFGVQTQPPIPLILPKAIIFPKPKAETKGVQGYNVFTKKRGQITKLNVNPLSEKEATNFGTFVVGTTARASLRLEKAKGVATQRFKGAGQRKDFRRGRGGWLVEKTSARINTPGELKEITLKGIYANKNKKKKSKKKKSTSAFGGVFKL